MTRFTAKSKDEVFARIRKNWGFLDDRDVNELRSLMPSPNMQVLVRCGGDRFLCGLRELEFKMAEVEERGDHVRDVCVPNNPAPTDWINLGYITPS